MSIHIVMHYRRIGGYRALVGIQRAHEPACEIIKNMQIDLKSVKRNWQWLKISCPKDHQRIRIAFQTSISSFVFVSTG